MAWKIEERILENLFVNMMIDKANIIKEHLNKSVHPLIIVANIGPTIAVFKFYDTNEKEDSLKLHMTLSNPGRFWWTNTCFVAASKLSVATIFSL